MKFRSSRIGRLLGSAGLKIPLFVVLCLFLGYSPALSIWLPWASEQDKVKKTVTDVWSALIRNDRIILKQNLTGTAVDMFINRERENILREKIREYTCRNYKIKIDPQTGSLAFVEFDKVATIQGGGQRTSAEVSVLRKIGSNWFMVVGVQKKARAPQDLRRLREEASKQNQNGAAAPRVDEPVSDELPPAEVSF
jgi:hypothetical protein